MVLLASQAAMPAPAAKPPKDAPFCLAPGTRPLFVAPMGEVFRGMVGGPDPAAAWIAQVDADHDGQVSRVEMIADADRFFRWLDKDNDGRLGPDEVAGYEQEVAPEISLYAGRRQAELRHGRGGLFSSGGNAGYAGSVGAGRFAWLNIPEPVAAADADLDRVVTLSEYREAAGGRFDALAHGGAGLSLAALPLTPQQAALKGPCRPLPKRRRDDPWDEREGNGA